MLSATTLIDSFIKTISETEIINESCQAIRAYENQNLPVPIKKTYFSFSAEENKVYFDFDENGNKKEINSLTVNVNCFIPLSFSPAVIYSLTETVMSTLMKSSNDIIGITVGKITYDSDVDAFRINNTINFQTEKTL